MAQAETLVIARLVSEHEREIQADWLRQLKDSGALQTGRITESELQTQAKNFLNLLRSALEKGDTTDHAAYGPVRAMLAEVSHARAVQGFSPIETATFVFSLKRSLFDALNRERQLSPVEIAKTTWAITVMLDDLGLYTMEVYGKAREEVISRQQTEISELSTPVVKLWDGILALPLIGTLDSARTQVVMENLLQTIVNEGAEIAIIDITGVPTVDTLTAQHLLKTVAAARLMGADCVISGIRPQIAQIIVHLGIELNVISKATLADAFAVALRRVGKTVTTIKSASVAPA